ncbi:thiamine ABC transporter substrate binding subunit [uncultured Tessaracoccus sp.]|uniref:thiamine ABC transporter substrate-binding protein n=1 Tax=uncultured Tessaracoccus sp. TaxID=905023 RepID=UPI0025E81E83|nr:thiamine ABC transporter substrate-binding protein [uncultured Tessaracoccus sp.]
MTRTHTIVSLAAAAALALTACSGGGSQESPAPEDAKTLTVVSHESFALPDDLKAKFEKDSGLKVEYTPLQDTGAMVNQLLLTKDSPLGDVVFGIDNTFASRAEGGDVIDGYVSDKLDERGKGLATKQMTPIDFGDVCVNADRVWFEKKKLAVPKTLDDLTKPEYKGLFVTPSPASSSPGLAFLFATIGAKGDGWKDYWKALKANGTDVVAGWTEAYNVEFTQGEGKGKRPLVLSYASSPAWTIGDDGKSTTVNLPETCFRQVEYAAVLKGAKNPDGAKQFVDFLLSDDVQASIPENMYMYPAIEKTPLPAEWKQFAPLSGKPIELSAEEIDKGREGWLQEWTDTIG